MQLELSMPMPVEVREYKRPPGPEPGEFRCINEELASRKRYDADGERLCNHVSVDGVACERRYGAGGYCYMHYSRSRREGADMDAPPEIHAAPPDDGMCTYVRKGKRCSRAHIAKGLCSMHYERNRTGRDMDVPSRIVRGADAKCEHVSRDGIRCANSHKALGLCGFHWDRARVGSDPDEPKKGTTMICTYEYPDGSMCKDRHLSRGLCLMHYQRQKKGKRLDAPRKGEFPTCTHQYPDGKRCEGKHSRDGLCSMHYYRLKNEQDMDTPKGRQSGNNKGMKVGTRRVRATGYVDVKQADGSWAKEHRLVMERHEKRKSSEFKLIGPLDGLDWWHEVHHRNRNKQDNDIENLELCVKVRQGCDAPPGFPPHPPGQRVADLREDIRAKERAKIVAELEARGVEPEVLEMILKKGGS